MELREVERVDVCERGGPGWAQRVAGWGRSAEEVLLWCGEREFPLTPETVRGWGRREDVRAYGLSESGVLVGYGELWLDDEEDEVELARIVVAPERRGQGIGPELVRRLAAEARMTGLAGLFLRVHPDNGTAVRCYERAGFHTVDGAAWNLGQPVEYVWMSAGEAEGG